MIEIFDKAFLIKEQRGWDFIYVAVDLHGTICDGLYSNDQKLEFYPYAKETLQLLSKKKSIVLILFTSTHPKELKRYLNWLKENDIFFDYVNENPDCPSTELADFSRKFYFNCLLDDKAGWKPEDWKELFLYFVTKGWV